MRESPAATDLRSIPDINGAGLSGEARRPFLMDSLGSARPRCGPFSEIPASAAEAHSSVHLATPIATAITGGIRDLLGEGAKADLAIRDGSWTC